jgi:hypothetical protein
LKNLGDKMGRWSDEEIQPIEEEIFPEIIKAWFILAFGMFYFESLFSLNLLKVP